jgi:hypothetical protein
MLRVSGNKNPSQGYLVCGANDSAEKAQYLDNHDSQTHDGMKVFSGTSSYLSPPQAAPTKLQIQIKIKTKHCIDF